MKALLLLFCLFAPTPRMAAAADASDGYYPHWLADALHAVVFNVL